MLLEHILNCVDGLYEDVIKSRDEELQTVLAHLQTLAPDEAESLVKKGIILSMSLCLNQMEFDDELFEGLLIENLDYICQSIPRMKKTITLKIMLRGLEEKVYRVMTFPYGMNLADVAYLILGALKADGSHVFTFIHDAKKYGCEQCDEDMLDCYAIDMTFADLQLQKGDCLSLWYDFGEDYFFDIVVEDIQNSTHIQSIEDVDIKEGNGYGIWEDAHELLEMYYRHHLQFLQKIQNMGLDETDFILEEFDKIVAQECLMEDYDFLKRAYEQE